MAKTLLYRLFRIGRIPQSMASVLNKEGMVLSEEGIGGNITYLNFRSPNRVSNWRRVWFSGSLVLTKKHLRGFAFSNTIIEIPLGDKRVRELTFTIEKEATLCIKFNASAFHKDWSGTIEIRFHTPLATEFRQRVQKRSG